MSIQPNLKYAQVESERRFLLDGLPPTWQEDPGRIIHDRYISGTRLRLRLVEAGNERTWKLGQKIRFDSRSPQRVAHTTLYLNEAEAVTIAALPATELVKFRRNRLVDGRLWAIDEFSGVLGGLILAELDLGHSGSMPASLPFAVVADVSGDDRFSGGALAQLAADGLTKLLASLEG